MNSEPENIIQSNFPFPPYPGQLAFATELYKLIGEGKVGVFESPTGTVGFDNSGQKYGHANWGIVMA